jgi:Protein of unknown function (DUF2924)
VTFLAEEKSPARPRRFIQENPPMPIYIIGNDGITLCREPPATVNEGEIAGASREELHAARLNGKRLLALWNALPRVEKQTKVGDRNTLPGLSHRAGELMSRKIHGAPARQKSGEPSSPIVQAANRRNAVGKEALSCLPPRPRRTAAAVDGLYKTQAPPNLSRELLVRAVAHRMQELALGGLRPEPRRQLLQIAQQFKQTGQATIRARPELKPGTRLMREWQGRTYDVLVLDDGFSWHNTRYRSLSAPAKKITGTAWSGPLFVGLKPNRPAARRSSQVPGAAGAPTVGSNAAG